MHGSVFDWFSTALAADEIKGMSILEVGSLNDNGSVRDSVELYGPLSYLGTDMRGGKGVNVIIAAEDLPKLAQGPGMHQAYDVVISTEMLEHAEDWRAAMRGMLEVMADGGLLLVTTRSKGFAFHSYPHDYQRFSLVNMRRIMEEAGMEIISLIDDPACPGVFLKARKPAGRVLPEGIWQDIHLDPPC